LYNAILVDEQPEGRALPKLMKLDGKRKGMIRARMKADTQFRTLEGWEKYFRLVASCPYLMGEVNEWTAQFNWLLNVGNMLKVQEGNYLPKQGKGKANKADSVSRNNQDVYKALMSKGA
jgi:hypothetical protein